MSHGHPEAGQYFIKAGYRENRTARATGAWRAEQFWHEGRIRSASQFQYWVYRFARGLVRQRGALRILDVGCGPPFKLRELFAVAPAELVLVDQPGIEPLARELLPAARFVPADLEAPPQDLGSRFDLVLCVDVLEHLLDPDPCLAFVGRHLATGGLAVLSTPERDALRGVACDHSPKPEHVREWNAAEFARYVESRGFRIERRTALPQQRLGAFEYRLSRLAPRLAPRRWASCQALAVSHPPASA